MSYTSGFLTGVGACALVVGTGFAAWYLLSPPAAPKKEKPAGPAKVGSPFQEDRAATVTLTPRALEVLGLRSGKVARQPMPRRRLYGGEVMVAAGHTALASTPLAGTVLAPEGGMPLPGRRVTKGQMVLRLVPILTPEAKATLATTQIEADGQVKSAKATVDAAKIALDRANRLLKQEAGSQRAVDEAEAQYEIARKTYDAAVARREHLADVLGEAGKGKARPLDIRSPEDGTLRALSVLPGQAVPAGAALFEVVDLARVWVRVPVYAAELEEIDRKKPARVKALSAPSAQVGVEAPVVQAPPSATPQAGTIDLYYSLDNSEAFEWPEGPDLLPWAWSFVCPSDSPQARFSPGHRVAALLPLKGEARPLTVPRAAVVYDYHGGAWVYERLGDLTFARRRVVVRHTVGDVVVLESGPPPGTEVVTARAAELFGAESGFTK